MFDRETPHEPLRPVRATAWRRRETIADFEGTPRAAARYFQLDGRGTRPSTADLPQPSRRSHAGRMKRARMAPHYIWELESWSRARAPGGRAEILASLNGDIRVHLRDASLSHLVIEAAGLDIAQALGLVFGGDKSLPILCNVIDLDVVNGVATPRAFVMNTRDSTIFVDGTVSLKTEAVDLRAVVSPKDFSPLTLRSPIHVRGTLGDPKVSVEAGKLVGKTGAAVLLGILVTPLAAIVPFVDPGADDAAKKAAAQCAALVPTSGRIAAATRVPASVRCRPPPGRAAGGGKRGQRRALSPQLVACR